MRNWTPESESQYRQILESLPLTEEQLIRRVLTELAGEEQNWSLEATGKMCAAIHTVVAPQREQSTETTESPAGEYFASTGDLFASNMKDGLKVTAAVRRALVQTLIENRENGDVVSAISCVGQRFDAMTEFGVRTSERPPRQDSELALSPQLAHEIEQARFDAVNRMIRGIAHESRNALQRIDACAEMLMLDVADNEDLLPLVQRLQLGASDLKGLFEEIKKFSAPLSLEYRQVPLLEIIDAAWSETEPLWQPRSVVFRVNLREPDVVLPLDPIRLTGGLQNLFISSLRCTTDPVLIEIHGQVAPNDSKLYELTIRDNGTPVEEKNAPRATEPFVVYRAKSPLLGIAFASRVIRAHGGSIELIDDISNGVAYRILLPRSRT
ncbi:sensor histidine kinase [Rubinisphaera brasiliensis]|uniref:histidine kinase n=1 Tax=Rubinisphaera brasiliensis (strain ATCC 49424 / DSM 5305 / JCM 21570 / IAM 15109 / NBRC 103401 / IFAM 1448) TaxID=756272 RepID=F0SKD4_RUBBR|nr:HAMP domain-containing sensor histidine kinase [Rubinisphaera brasiliensis]ADY60891.1 histidine kinase [Rubinisphaera brasiliensis DSM 5305]